MVIIFTCSAFKIASPQLSSSELLIQVAKFTLLIVITSIIISFLTPASPSHL